MAKRGRPPTRRSKWGTVRLKPSGNYQASYRYGGTPGVSLSAVYYAPTTFQTEGDARAWLASERRLIESGEWTPPAARLAAQRAAEEARLHSETLREYATRWLEQDDLRPSTRARYDKLLRYYVYGDEIPAWRGRKARTVTKRGLGEVRMAELTGPRIAAWWRSLPLDEYRRSCDLAYQLLRTICRAAVEEDEIMPEMPKRVAGAGRPSTRRTVEPLTPSRVQAIADAMRPKAWRLGTLLAARCALRSGEVRELRRKDIDTGKGVIHVRRGVIRAGATVVVGDPKTDAGRRDVLVPPSLLPDVEAHLRDYAQPGPEGLLFYSTNGGQADDRTWRAAFQAACKTAGVFGYVFHDLRHVALTWDAQAGATVRELQARAGHTTAAAALRYQEVASSHLARVVEEADANYVAQVKASNDDM